MMFNQKKPKSQYLPGFSSSVGCFIPVTVRFRGFIDDSKDVTGFLDLRWARFVREKSQLGRDGWLNVYSEKFVEFIMWVADVV